MHIDNMCAFTRLELYTGVRTRGAGEAFAPPVKNIGGQSPPKFIILFFAVLSCTCKRPSRCSQNAQNRPRDTWKTKIFLGEHAPRPPYIIVSSIHLLNHLSVLCSQPPYNKTSSYATAIYGVASSPGHSHLQCYTQKGEGLVSRCTWSAVYCTKYRRVGEG